MTLEHLLTLAAENNPELGMARARIAAARGRLIQAGLYPNPLVLLREDQINHFAGPAGDLGVTLTQEIVTAGKLRLARAAAAQGVAVADWQAITRWYEVTTRVRLAYYEMLTAQREVQTSQEIVGLAQENLNAALKLRDAGTGTQLDVLRAKVDLDESRIRLGVAQQRLNAAWKLIGVAVGYPELPPTPVAGTLETAVPRYDWQPVLATVLTRSSEVQEAHAAVLEAERRSDLARAERFPNVQVTVRPFYSFPGDQGRILVQAGGALPIFNRNQGNIASARAEIARAAEQARQVELRLTERLTSAYQRYSAASQQVDLYRQLILKNAAESLRLVRLGYEKGDPKYDYTALLQAQRVLVQAQLTYVGALGELWRATSEIAGLLQQDDLNPVAPPATGGE